MNTPTTIKFGQQRGPINYAKTSILSQPGNPRYYTPGSQAPGTKIGPDRKGKYYIVGEAGNLINAN